MKLSPKKKIIIGTIIGLIILGISLLIYFMTKKSICEPDCTGKKCGEGDGCSGKCEGNCEDGTQCNKQTGKCECKPVCTGKKCGESDGCSGKCEGNCEDGTHCNKKTGKCDKNNIMCYKLGTWVTQEWLNNNKPYKTNSSFSSIDDCYNNCIKDNSCGTMTYDQNGVCNYYNAPVDDNLIYINDQSRGILGSKTDDSKGVLSTCKQPYIVKTVINNTPYYLSWSIVQGGRYAVWDKRLTSASHVYLGKKSLYIMIKESGKWTKKELTYDIVRDGETRGFNDCRNFLFWGVVYPPPLDADGSYPKIVYYSQTKKNSFNIYNYWNQQNNLCLVPENNPVTRFISWSSGFVKLDCDRYYAVIQKRDDQQEISFLPVTE